ncbi:MAG TPA: hypothetical protein VLZ74_09705 [Methylocella sp.]|nr:hypothetical protein [Methylocella sp.]
MLEGDEHRPQTGQLGGDKTSVIEDFIAGSEDSSYSDFNLHCWRLSITSIAWVTEAQRASNAACKLANSQPK